jgi:hypothetical protein
MIRLILILVLLTSSVYGSGWIDARLGQAYNVDSGDTVEVSLFLNSELAIGGIDFRVRYDSTLLEFVQAVQDSGLSNWELFTPTHEDSFSLVQVLAIADIQNGPVHPDPEDFYPRGSAARYTFVAIDWPPDSVFTPLTFYWKQCGDNAVSNTEGDSLIVISRLFDHTGKLIWDETDDMNFPDSIRPDNIGLPDSCFDRRGSVHYLIELRTGGFDSHYLCGDIDANSTINVSDIVQLINFVFAGGTPPDPVETGDLDCNGSVNVSDVVSLIAFIFGDGEPPCASCP